MEITRRSLLQVGAFTALGAATLSVPLDRRVEAKSASRLDRALMPRPYRTPFLRPSVAVPDWTGRDEDGAPLHHYTITQRAGAVSLVPGLLTPVHGYEGSIPGPTIDVEQGTHVQVRMRNQLPASHPRLGYPDTTSTHLHGSASLPQYDGYASDVTFPGWVKTYRYPNFQPARTIWYHDHGVHHTAENAYWGLVGRYHLHDPVERALLPQGEFDVPVTISDIMLAADGGLGYDDNSHSGLFGDIVLVNGRPWPVMRVKRRVYRFRILNACVSRALKLSLSTGEAVHVVATDGGLVPVTRAVTSWRHGGAERYEVLIDFTGYRAGTRVELRNGSLPNVVDYANTNRVMAFDVTDEPVDTTDPTWRTLPGALADSPVMRLTEKDAVRTRNVRLHRDAAGRWVINGTTWDDVVASGYRKVIADPDLDDVEIWEVENRSGGWYHPLHIHLVDFKVLSRNGRPPADYELGPKDVVVVGESEKVRLIMRFEHQRGRYMVHCHNLPHEDHDMMTQFSVGMKGVEVDVNDPITADPCTPDPDA